MKETLHENMNTNCRIIKESDDTTLFEKFCSHGYIIRYNVDYMSEGHYEWDCQVVGKQIDNALNHREDLVKKEIQNSFKKLLNL